MQGQDLKAEGNGIQSINGRIELRIGNPSTVRGKKDCMDTDTRQWILWWKRETVPIWLSLCLVTFDIQASSEKVRRKGVGGLRRNRRNFKTDFSCTLILVEKCRTARQYRFVIPH